MKIASLCVLAYKRPDMLEKCLQSLQETIDYPCEIIVNFDGIDSISEIMFALMKKYSKAIINRGNNRGVGRSFQSCLGVAEGDYIFKIDTDLIFKPHWLSTAINILDNNHDVSTVSLFDYTHYNPDDHRFTVKDPREDCFIVDDFVSSIYGFKKERLLLLGKNYLKDAMPDDGLHSELSVLGKLAITKEDFVTNSGFGLGKSVYVVPDAEGNPVKAQTHDEPLIFTS